MPFLLLRHLQTVNRTADIPAGPGLWRTPLGRSACLSAAAVLLVGVGLPYLAGARADDTGSPASMLLGALLGSALAIGRRGPALAAWWRTRRAQRASARPDTLGAPFDRTCRALQTGLRERGHRLVCHIGAAARDLVLPDDQLGRLLQSLDAAVRLLCDDPDSTGPGADRQALVRIELDRLEGETGNHLRMRLSGGQRHVQPRCARRLRQLSTRLGAQLDLVERGGLLQVELVLKLSAEPA